MTLPGRDGLELTLARLAGASASASLVLIAAMFAWRRWWVGFPRPMGLSPLLQLSLALPAVILLAVWPWTRGDSQPRSASRLIHVGLVVGGVLLAAAASIPGSSLLGVAGLWCLLGATVAVLCVRGGTTTRGAAEPTAFQPDVQWNQPVTLPVNRSPTEEPLDAEPLAEDLSAEEPIDEEPIDEEPIDEELAEHVLQQYVRGLQPDGDEYISLRARVPVQAGQRLAHFHLTICPPLTGAVQAQADIVGDAAAQVEIGQVLPQGVRLDLRLDPAPDEDTEVIVECFVTGQRAIDG